MNLLLLLSFVLPSLAARTEPTLEEQYELGLKYMKRGYYTKALEQFNRIRNYHRDDPMAVKAELAIGDVYFKKSEWDQARIVYEDFMRMHPRHPDLDYVVYRIGMSLFKKAPKVAARDQTWTRQAVNTWTGYSARFPDSEYREEAEDLLLDCRERLAHKELLIAEYYEREEAWVAVDGRARGLVERYPDSADVPEALTLMALSAAWQGRSEDARLIHDKLLEKDPEAADRLQRKLARVKPDKAS